MKLARYRKFIIAAIGALAVIGAEVPEGAPSWLTGFFAVVSPLAVVAVPNAVTPSQRAQVVAEQAEARRGTTYRPGPRHERGPGDPLE